MYFVGLKGIFLPWMKLHLAGDKVTLCFLVKEIFMFILFSRSRYSRVPSSTLQKTKEDTNGVQSIAATQIGTRFREKPLRRRCGKKTVGAVIVANGNAGESIITIEFNHIYIIRDASI